MYYEKVLCDPKKECSAYWLIPHYVLKHLTYLIHVKYTTSDETIFFFLDYSSNLAILAFNNLSIHSIFIPHSHFFFYCVNPTWRSMKYW